MDYRRVYVPGGTYFFTVVTDNRRPIFSTPDAVEKLREAFRYTMDRFPFIIVACVILPDHIHFIWALPPDACDYSTRWRLIKSHFTRHWHPRGAISASPSRKLKGEADVWQRRFWEHMIRDEVDLANHVEYIHYNPVKHGLVKAPADWEYSSFRKYVEDGLYAVNWGGDGKVFAGKPWME